MQQLDIIRNEGSVPKRIKNAYGNVPSYKTLPKNACFLVEREGEETIVVGDVTDIRKGMLLRLKPELVNTDALMNHYLWGVYRHACHLVLHVENGIGCLKSRNGSSWVDIITPATRHFFEEVKIRRIQENTGLEPSHKTLDEVLAEEPKPVEKGTPVHSRIVSPSQMPTVELRLETFDRMMGHAIEFIGDNLNSSPTTQAVDTLFQVASDLTDRALNKYAN